VPKKNPRDAQDPKRLRPRFALSGTALALLRSVQPRGPICCRCGVTPERSYVESGPAVEEVALDVRRRGSGNRMPGVSVRLRCGLCGARRTVRAAALPPEAARHWLLLCAILASVGDGDVVAPPASPELRVTTQQVVPSRRDPAAPPITDDELIEAVRAIRRARTWGEVLGVLGCGGDP
jgi:hypothetical protein